jgi:hypothetical protein
VLAGCLSAGQVVLEREIHATAAMHARALLWLLTLLLMLHCSPYTFLLQQH